MKNDIHTEIITYTCDGETFKGFLAIPAIDKKVPGIVVAHAWKGLDEFARKKAIALAELGYAALAADVYGNGAVAESDEEAAALMLPLFLDRLLLQRRIRVAYDALCNNPLVDNEKIGAIGFCFGGLTAIELFRSGAPLRGTVSFHAILGNKIGQEKAKTTSIASGIDGKLLILHGHDDPLISAEDISAIQKELTESKIDWQMVIYGNTSHAFTNPEAHDTKHGLIYNADADRRSWRAMRNFFEETLS